MCLQTGSALESVVRSAPYKPSKSHLSRYLSFLSEKLRTGWAPEPGGKKLNLLTVRWNSLLGALPMVSLTYDGYRLYAGRENGEAVTE
jgi:hypothetical protein